MSRRQIRWMGPAGETSCSHNLPFSIACPSWWRSSRDCGKDLAGLPFHPIAPVCSLFRVRRMNCDSSASQLPFRRSALIAGAVRLAVVAALVLPVAACGGFDAFGLFGGEKYQTKIEPEVAPDTAYDQGIARLQKGDSDGAAKAFSDVDKQYPNSQWSRKGLLMATYAQYNAGQYDDAVASANRYIGLYPYTPDTAYAMYLAGMSMYNQIPDISRDQERSQKAL